MDIYSITIETNFFTLISWRNHSILCYTPNFKRYTYALSFKILCYIPNFERYTYLCSFFQNLGLDIESIDIEK